MGGIIDKITEFIKELLQGWVLTNFETMFTDVNDKVGTIAGEVSKTPSTWNSGIFDMIKTLSDNVMIPIAGMIISFVLVYELISMVIDKNNLHDFNTAIFIRFFMKACIAVMPENMKISKPYIDKQLAEVLTQQEQIQRKSSRIATDFARLSVFKGNLREMEVQQRVDEQAREQNRDKKHENTI